MESNRQVIISLLIIGILCMLGISNISADIHDPSSSITPTQPIDMPTTTTPTTPTTNPTTSSNPPTTTIPVTTISENDEGAVMAFEYGKDIDKFLDKDADGLRSYIGRKYFEEFYKGIKENPKSLEKLRTSWFDMRDGKALLDDEFKQKLWDRLIKEDKGFAKELAKKAFERLKSKYPELYGNNHKGISEFNIEKEGLVWKGNKLGIPGKDGEVTGWIDFDNLQRWITKIDYKEDGKFYLSFDTGNGLKKVSFDKGSIGSMGELIGPDGKTIGTRMNEGLQSIIFNADRESFTVKYHFEGEEKSIEVGKSDIDPEIFQNLRDQMQAGNADNPEAQKYRELLEGIMSDLNGLGTKPDPEEIKRELNGLGIDLSAGNGPHKLPTDNMINVLHGGNYDNEEIINIDYDEKGNPKIAAALGGTIVTTDYLGKVKAQYRQFYSKDGIVGKGQDSNLDYLKKNNGEIDEFAEFSFSKDGEIKAAKNARVQLFQQDKSFGTIFTSRSEMEGIEVVRNSFVDAISRGDVSKIVNSIINEPGFSEKIDKALAGEDVDMKIELMRILHENLQDPNLKTELRNKMNFALEATIQNLEQSEANMLLFYATMGREVDGLSEYNQQAVDNAISSVTDETREAVREILRDPSVLKVLADYKDTGNKEEFNRVLKATLKNRVGSLQSFYSNPLTDQIAESILTATTTVKKPVDIRDWVNSNTISSVVDSIDFHELFTNEDIRRQLEQGASPSEFIVNALKEKSRGLVKDDEIEGIGRTFDFFINEIEAKVKQEKKTLKANIERDLKAKNDYPTTIKVDMQAKSLEYSGNKYMSFDANVPMSSIKVDSKRTSTDHADSVFVLYSSGMPVVKIDGDKTFTGRIVNNVAYQPINRIINLNENNPKGGLKLDTAGGFDTGYSLYYPEALVSKRHMVTAGLLRAHPAMQTTIIAPGEGDIGSNPDARVEMTNVIGSDSGRQLFGRIFAIAADLFLPEGIPLDQAMADPQSQARQRIDMMFEKMGGREDAAKMISAGDRILSFAQDEGITFDRQLEMQDKVAAGKNIVANGFDNSDLGKMFDFISSGKLAKGESIVITPTSLSVGSRTLTDQDINPAFFREFMRQLQIEGNKPNSQLDRQVNPLEEMKKQKSGSTSSSNLENVCPNCGKVHKQRFFRRFGRR